MVLILMSKKALSIAQFAFTMAMTAVFGKPLSKYGTVAVFTCIPSNETYVECTGNIGTAEMEKVRKRVTVEC